MLLVVMEYLNGLLDRYIKDSHVRLAWIEVLV